MASKFPTDLDLVEILGTYFKDTVYDLVDTGIKGIRRYTCLGYTISNDIHKALSHTTPIFTFNFKYQHIDKLGNITYTENKSQYLFLGEILNHDRRNDIIIIFNLSYADVQHLLKLWYEFIIPTEKWVSYVFEKSGFPKEFIEVLIDKGYFNTERYTIDELITLSNILNNTNIIPRDARDIFIF